MYSSKFFSSFYEENAISSIRQDDCLVGYEVVPRSELLPEDPPLLDPKPTYSSYTQYGSYGIAPKPPTPEPEVVHEPGWSPSELVNVKVLFSESYNSSYTTYNGASFGFPHVLQLRRKYASIDELYYDIVVQGILYVSALSLLLTSLG